jgi:hypothetical protein
VASGTVADAVPYITLWSTERTAKARVVHRHGGIAYVQERPGDRDRHGVLWTRVTSRPGEGRPEFGKVHARRQRRAMRLLLCQVCGGPADRNADGVLWLVGEDQGQRASWPDPLLTAHPPVCVRCAVRSVGVCPHLRRQQVALRVHDFDVVGVRGTLYRPALPDPVKVAAVGVALDDPRIRWMRAGQILVNLRVFSLTSLDALTGR